mgnify:CR=1 FL=1
MTESRLIEILPHIYIGNCSDELLEHNNITNIININSSKKNYQNYNTLNIAVTEMEEFVHSDDFINLDFNTMNDFIVEILKKNEKVVICDNATSIAFAGSCSFILKFIGMSFTNTITYVQRKMNLDIKTIPQILIFQLFEYYTK